MLLEGIYPAITTPFSTDGGLYAQKLEQNVERYSRTPAKGLVVLGSTGEALLLDDAEAREALRIAASAVAAEKVLVAGVGQGSVLATVRMAEYAASVGYDAALVRTPYFYVPQMTTLAMLTYFRTIADRSPIPVVLYSIPKFTHYDLPVELIAELAWHPNIFGLKDSSGSVERIRAVVEATAAAPRRTVTVTPTFEAVTGRMQAAGAADGLVSIGGSGTAASAAKLRTRTREVGFQVLGGASDKLLASLDAGASGGVLGLAACAPQACHEVYIAWKEGDRELAELKQERIVEASSVVVAGLGVAGVKYGCDLNGYYGGPARLPLLPLTGEQRGEVERAMRDLRN